MANPRIQLRLDPEQKDKLEEAAKRRGVSVADAAREALDLWSNLDDDFLGRVKNLSESFGSTLHTTVQNLALTALANEGAWDRLTEEVHGVKRENTILPRASDGSIITGEAFLERQVRESWERVRHEMLQTVQWIAFALPRMQQRVKRQGGQWNVAKYLARPEVVLQISWFFLQIIQLGPDDRWSIPDLEALESLFELLDSAVRDFPEEFSKLPREITEHQKEMLEDLRKLVELTKDIKMEKKSE